MLSELLKDNVNPSFEGYIIRDMLSVNGFNISNLLLNERLGFFFNFKKTNIGNIVNVSYENNLGLDLYNLNIHTNQFVGNSNNLYFQELLEEQEPDYYGQSVKTSRGFYRIHKNALIINNELGETIAFITPDEKFFFWADNISANGFFKSDRTTEKNSYSYYVEDKYMRQSEPVSWGIHRAADDTGELILNLINDPNTTIRNFATGLKKLATLDFNIEKTWEAISNADLSDASYFTASIALAYLSGPKGTGAIVASETAQFQELLAHYAPKLSRPGRLTWPQLLELFRKAIIFEKAISSYLKTLYTASNGYKVFNQVYLKIDGVVSIVDDLIYNSNTGKWIINETKYGASNILTKNQTILQDAIKAGKKIEIRTAEALRDASGRIIANQGSFIEIVEILRSNSINGSIIFDTVKTTWKK